MILVQVAGGNWVWNVTLGLRPRMKLDSNNSITMRYPDSKSVLAPGKSQESHLVASGTLFVEDFILEHLASHVNCQGEEFVICDSSGTLAIFDEVASNVGSQQACGKDESEGPMAVEIFKAMFLCFESKPAALAHGLAWIFNSTYCKGKGKIGMQRV